MKTVTATPMMSPMATTPPRIPITPPGGPCGNGFSADNRRNNSVKVGALSVIDAARLYLEGKKRDQKKPEVRTKTHLIKNSEFSFFSCLRPWKET